MSEASRQQIWRTPGQWLIEGGCAFVVAVLMIINLAPGAQGQAVLPPPPPVVSTIPSNGDVNPYGVAIAPLHLAAGLVLQHDDVPVTNFNNAENLQGTGTTIVRVDRGGHSSLFFQGTQTSGLTAALGIVNRGYVFAGSLPTADGTAATAQAGSLLVLDVTAPW